MRETKTEALARQIFKMSNAQLVTLAITDPGAIRALAGLTLGTPREREPVRRPLEAAVFGR